MILRETGKERKTHLLTDDWENAQLIERSYVSSFYLGGEFHPGCYTCPVKRRMCFYNIGTATDDENAQPKLSVNLGVVRDCS